MLEGKSNCPDIMPDHSLDSIRHWQFWAVITSPMTNYYFQPCGRLMKDQNFTKVYLPYLATNLMHDKLVGFCEPIMLQYFVCVDLYFFSIDNNLKVQKLSSLTTTF